MNVDLFSKNKAVPPLAERVRPATFDDVVGIPALSSTDAPLRKLIESGRVPSLVFWGPPGSGKTTLARIVSRVSGGPFVHFSAVTSGIKDIRLIFEESHRRAAMDGARTLLFVDEIHHFNKSQQDAFLPHIEDGTIVLLGATIENPSFYLNAALLSRVRVVEIHPPTEDDLLAILTRALAMDEATRRAVGEADPETLRVVARWANGDARRALGLLEELAGMLPGDGHGRLDQETLTRLAPSVALRYDKAGDEHYDLISAFIKSVRGSDPDAALYWLARMLEAGEDPLFLLRRLVILASEDVGNADPRALQVAVAAMESFRFIGMPEGYLPLAQATAYLASAPKSNAAYAGFQAARAAVRETGNQPVPMQLRNAPTRLMKDLGRSEGYQYPHDWPDGVAPGVEYLPPALKGRRFYEPKDIGFERHLGEFLAWVRGHTT